MLQCQNHTLSGQVLSYQLVAKKTTVCVAEYNYQKRKGKVNTRKVHWAIAKAGVNWDEDT